MYSARKISTSQPCIPGRVSNTARNDVDLADQIFDMDVSYKMMLSPSTK